LYAESFRPSGACFASFTAAHLFFKAATIRALPANRVTGEIWSCEDGPNGGDEVNILQPGHNYGWPIITYGMNYDGTPITDHMAQAGMHQPVTYWVPSIATSPITFYTGNRFPEWKNNLFLGSLQTQELVRIAIDGHSVTHREILFKGIGRVRDVVNGLGVEPPEEDGDAEITDAMRMVIDMDPLIHSKNIQVQTNDRVVRLSGAVESDEESKEAERDAWCLFGVNRVENLLSVG